MKTFGFLVRLVLAFAWAVPWVLLGFLFFVISGPGGLIPIAIGMAPLGIVIGERLRRAIEEQWSDINVRRLTKGEFDAYADMGSKVEILLVERSDP